MRKWTFASIAVFATFGLHGCAENSEDGQLSRKDKAELVSITKEIVAIHLSDPDSARFRNMGVYEKPLGGFVVCGEVNGKNRLGGYVGYRRFFFNGTERNAVNFDPSDREYKGWCR